MNLPYAEDINFWKTGKSTPDTWLDRAEKIIENLGGEVHLRAIGKIEDRKAFMIDFSIPPENFRILWPVLPTRGDDEKSAERQAATLLYHDVKARALRASIFGAKNAFFEFNILPDGRTISQLTLPELIRYQPKAISAPK